MIVERPVVEFLIELLLVARTRLKNELKQPLGAILSNAQAMRRFLAAKKPDLAEISAAVEEIICDNLRAVEVIRIGHYPPRPQKWRYRTIHGQLCAGR